MVEDHRAEIGTMKALGFSTASISIKYIGYAEADWSTQATEGYRKIYGFLLDTKTVMRKQISSSISRRILIDYILSVVHEQGA